MADVGADVCAGVCLDIVLFPLAVHDAGRHSLYALRAGVCEHSGQSMVTREHLPRDIRLRIFACRALVEAPQWPCVGHIVWTI